MHFIFFIYFCCIKSAKNTWIYYTYGFSRSVFTLGPLELCVPPSTLKEKKKQTRHNIITDEKNYSLFTIFFCNFSLWTMATLPLSNFPFKYQMQSKSNYVEL